MTYADTISRDTANFNPRIERLPSGDIVFRWSRFVHPTTIDDTLGLDDMVVRDSDGFPCLEVPMEIAEQVMA
jgi:hypothetical protein